MSLGEPAKAALEQKQYAGKPGGDAELAVQLWWRAAGLEALQAYVMAVLGGGLLPSGAEGVVQAIAVLLQPLLEAAANQVGRGPGSLALLRPVALWQCCQGRHVVPRSCKPATSTSAARRPRPLPPCPSPQPLLQEPWKAKGQVGCAAALLQLRLLEAYFVLPAASLWAGDHAQLIKLCCRHLRSPTLGGPVPFDAALALSQASLRRMLSGQDGVLGPWVPGREELEDELRAYAGGPPGCTPAWPGCTPAWPGCTAAWRTQQARSRPAPSLQMRRS